MIKRLVLSFFILSSSLVISQERLGKVSISKVYFDSPFNTEGVSGYGEYIELFNSSTSDINISFWKLYDNDGFYIFPPGTIIKAGKHKVIAYGGSWDLSNFTFNFPHAVGHEVDILFQRNLQLNNKIDTVVLINEENRNIDRITYGNWYRMPSSNVKITAINNRNVSITDIIPTNMSYGFLKTNVNGYYKNGDASVYAKSAISPFVNPLNIQLLPLEPPIVLDPEPPIVLAPEPQFSNENFIHTIVPQIETTSILSLKGNQKIENITYFDGLGRPMQSIAIQQGGTTQKDIITYIGYDALGRKDKDYLPYVHTDTGSDGTYRTDALSATNSFYNTAKYENTTNPYSEQFFDGSPLNLVVEKAAPGNDWKEGILKEHTIKNEYKLIKNTDSVYNFQLLYYTNGTPYGLKAGLFTIGGTPFKAPTLYKFITKNENWSPQQINLNDNTTQTFKDFRGRIILNRTFESNVRHDTYYVYDTYGNLIYVITPNVDISNGVDSSELSLLCYQYLYDGKNRLVEKKIPGKDWEYIVYDNLDRPVLTQDGNLKLQNKWLFTKYDVFGRVAYTGIYSINSTRSALQTIFNGKTASENYENKVKGTGTGYDNTYYNNNQYPNTGLEVLTVNYYDNYNFDLAGCMPPGANVKLAYGSYITLRTKGLATGSKVKVLTTNNWITTVSYYDEKARPIHTYSYNDYLKTTDVVSSQLDFVGKVTETTTAHMYINDLLPTITTVDKFDYDHAGRLLSQKQTIGSNPEEVIVKNTYDELGKLTSKGVGGKTTKNRLQTVDYTYNIRGWLKGINDPASLGTDLFGFKLNYNTAEHGGTALYNGNIAETAWSTANTDKSLKWYKYGYDNLNRITSGIDNTADMRYSLSTVGYDKNGNITNLARNGQTNTEATTFGVMDQLTYSYLPNSNKLMKVSDAAIIDSFGFKDDALNTTADTVDDYSYDVNGNMLTDTNKGITAITYNHLNLPTLVTMTGGTISYIYDATGVKQRKIVSPGATTDYAGNYVYENNTLQFFNQPEGYVEPNGSGWNYVYQYKDHLGNIRLSYADSNNDGVVTSGGTTLASVFYDDLENSSGWDSVGALYGSSATMDSEHTQSGNTAAKLYKSGVGDIYAHSNEWITINNSKPTDYIFSGWIYAESPGYLYTRILLFMNEDTETGYFTQTAGDKIYTKDQWVYVEKKVTVPANINKINLRLDIYTSSSSATAWFDNLSIRKVNSTSEIVEENNYYPYGLKHKGYNNVITSTNIAQKYKTYQGQELTDELGYNMLEFKYRHYDPAIARFVAVDPLAEMFPHQSPYVYCSNNPMNRVDPTGMSDYPVYDKNGSYLGDDGRIGGDLAFTGEKDGKGGFKNLQQFTDNHTDFTKASGKLKSESSGNKTESLWIAHTAENASNNKDTTKGDGAVGQLLSNAYSTTTGAASSIKDNSSKTNNARAGLIDVLSGGADPTGGSVLWDGQDFLPKGLNHNKFKEYGNVTIGGTDLNSLISNQNSLYGTKASSDFAQTNTLFPTYSGWSGGNFYSNEPSKNKTYYNLTSGGTQGGTIFWQISKK